MSLDIATIYGFTIGRPGEIPLSGHGNFKPTEATDGAIFFACLKWANEFFAVHRPTALFIEEPRLIMARNRNQSGATLKRLWGLSAVAQAVAHGRGVLRAEVVTADDVRRHFIGMKKALKGDEAKRLTQERCTLLGIPWQTPDEADSIALWAYGCEKVAPGTGHAFSASLFPGAAIPKGRPQERMTAKQANELLFKKK